MTAAATKGTTIAIATTTMTMKMKAVAADAAAAIMKKVRKKSIPKRRC